MDEIGLDDLGYELPGEDAEGRHEVVMLIRCSPMMFPAGAERKTAHLRVRIISNETATADNADDAASEVEFIAKNLNDLKRIWKTTYKQSEASWLTARYSQGRIRQNRGELVDKTFEHWNVTEGSGGSLEFAWRSDGSQNVINDGGQILQVIQMYGQDYDRNIGELYEESLAVVCLTPTHLIRERGSEPQHGKKLREPCKTKQENRPTIEMALSMLRKPRE